MVWRPRFFALFPRLVLPCFCMTDWPTSLGTSWAQPVCLLLSWCTNSSPSI